MTNLTMARTSFLADVIIGPHGLLAPWLFDVVARLVAYDPSRFILRLDRTDPIEFLTGPKPVVLTSYPSAQIVSAIADHDVGVIYAVEDPLDVSDFMCRALKLQPLEAITAQTSSAVANLAIGAAPHVLYIERSTERNVVNIVQSIVRHLSLDLTNDQIDAVVTAVSRAAGPQATLEEALAARGGDYARPVRGGGAVAFGEMDFVAVQAIEPLIAMARGSTVRPVVWPTAVFRFGDRPDQPPPRQADIGGPPRNLFYGPYLYLPPARYRAEISLGFSEEVGDIPFSLEFHSSGPLAHARIDKRRADDYRGHCLIDHVDCTASVEIRLRNTKGIKKGRLSLVELTFFVEPVSVS